MVSNGTLHTLTFYTQTYQRDQQSKKERRLRKLEIEVLPSGTPLGPSYDLYCAQDQEASPTPVGKSATKKRLTIQKFKWTKTIKYECGPGSAESTTETKYYKVGEQNVTLNAAEDQPLVVHFEGKSLLEPFEDIVRNVSLWLKDNGKVRVAVGYLQQKKFELKDRIDKDERWSCANVEGLDDDDDDDAVLETTMYRYHIKEKEQKFKCPGNSKEIEDILKIANRAAESMFLSPFLVVWCFVYFVVVSLLTKSN